MAVKKITFDGGNVTARMDADINYLNSSKIAEGVFDLYFDGVSPLTITVANNNIYISKGYIEVYGRRILIEDNTSVYVSLDKVAYGSIVVEVDLDSDSVELKAIEGSSSAYPSLTQENLFEDGKIYQFNICNFYKTTSSITIYTITHNMIIAPQDMLTFDNVPTAGSSNPVKSGGVYSALEERLNKNYLYTGTSKRQSQTIVNTESDGIKITRSFYEEDGDNHSVTFALKDDGIKFSYSGKSTPDDEYRHSFNGGLNYNGLYVDGYESQEEGGVGARTYLNQHGVIVNTYGDDEEETYITDTFSLQTHVVLHKITFAGAGSFDAFSLYMLGDRNVKYLSAGTIGSNRKEIINCICEGSNGFIFGGISSDGKTLYYYAYNSTLNAFVRSSCTIDYTDITDTLKVLK